MSPRYLTKSRFKIGLECPTGLYYTNKSEVYADGGLGDPFLAALADGGFQVGEMAKFLFCNDPVAEKITIYERDYETSLQKTNEKLKSQQTVIAEAAVKYNNLFIRADILVKNKKNIDLYEVKSKSWKKDKTFWNKNETALTNDWLIYLYDVAFQKYVLQKAFPGYRIKAHLILADADCKCTIDRMNQLFKITKEENRNKIIIKEGTTKKTLGVIPLKVINVDKECDWIYSNPAQVDLEKEYSFEELILFFSNAYQNDERIWSPIGSKCRNCGYTSLDDPSELKSGFHECWENGAKFKKADFKKVQVMELWGGKAGSQSLVGNAINNKKYFLSDLKEEDYYPRSFKPKEFGLHPAERRKLQIEKCSGNTSCYLDKNGLKKVFKKLAAPWHFIDFETSMVALPFHKGRTPYEAIAFQYSYHMMDEKGAIVHKNQYLSTDNKFPNYDFLRSLKKDLGHQKGTIFRYHIHENTYLKHIYKQLLKEDEKIVPDKKELIKFLCHISHGKDDECGEWEGEQDMQDLYELVLSYYYSPHAKGSNGLKYILPAAINDSQFLKDKYSKPIYGTKQIQSLNFTNHIWIDKKYDFNPYHTLPDVLQGYENEKLDTYFSGMDEIKDGGAAMIAYSYLQFTDISEQQKNAIRNALFRYCELDTMAMVMLWEFWGNEIGMW